MDDCCRTAGGWAVAGLVNGSLISSGGFVEWSQIPWRRRWGGPGGLGLDGLTTE